MMPAERARLAADRAGRCLDWAGAWPPAAATVGVWHVASTSRLELWHGLRAGEVQQWVFHAPCSSAVLHTVLDCFCQVLALGACDGEVRFAWRDSARLAPAAGAHGCQALRWAVMRGAAAN